MKLTLTENQKIDVESLAVGEEFGSDGFTVEDAFCVFYAEGKIARTPENTTTYASLVASLA